MRTIPILILAGLILALFSSPARANVHDIYQGGAWDPYDPVKRYMAVSHWPPCNEFVAMAQFGGVYRHPSPSDGRIGVWVARSWTDWRPTQKVTADRADGTGPVSYGEFIQGDARVLYERASTYAGHKVVWLRNGNPDGAGIVLYFPC
jgi:hypothetical protein